MNSIKKLARGFNFSRARKLLVITKVAVILFGTSILSVNANTFAQNITLKRKNVTLSSVFKDIRTQSGYDFLYSQGLMKKGNLVTIDVTNQSLQSVLDLCVANQPFTYTIAEKTVIIKMKPAELPVNTVTNLKNITIRGKITDETGQPLPGASVKVKGTAITTTSNTDGNFTLQNVEENAILQVSYVGYVMQEIPARESLQVKLLPLTANLDDVVVVGYGVQKKANLTGAVSTVNMNDVMADRTVSSTSQVLQGAAAGLLVVTNSGQPGQASSLNVRGFTSINGGAPLVLVDNVPMSMDDVNPRDIESVSVLKDAAASSIYGARAAFGVVLITTKKGNRNQPIKFDYSLNVASTDASTLPQKTTTARYVQALKDFGNTDFWTGQNIAKWSELITAYQSDASKYPTGIAVENGVRYPLQDNDVYGAFFTGGQEQQHNMSMSGGSEKTNYRVSLGYVDENGIIVTDADNYRRYNLNSFLSTSLTDKLTASLNVLYKNDIRRVPQDYAQLFYSLVNFAPYTQTGYDTAENGDLLPYNAPNNLVGTEESTKYFNDNLRLFSKLDYQLLKNLNITGEYTFNKTNANMTNVIEKNEYINVSNYNRMFQNQNSQYIRENSLTNYHSVNLYAKYAATLANDHHFDILVGTNHEISKQERFRVSRLDLITQEVPSLSTSTGTLAGSDGFNEFAVSGYFARLNYNYKGRYLLEVNGRADGSSRFPAGDRFGFFPSFSAGWNVHEEGFMSGLKNIFQTVKLRGSFGQVGNQIVLIRGTDTQDYYPYLAGMTPSNAGWINPATNIRYLTLSSPTLVSSSFTWERVQTANVGLDLGLLNNKLNLSVDVFNRQTKDMLSNASELPAVLGIAAPLQNVADLKSKGWEFQVSWKDKINDFGYSFGLNLSDNRAYITKFKNTAGLLSDYYVGQEINEIWGYQTQGFFTEADFVPGSLNANLQNGKLLPGIAPYNGVSQNPGDIRYADLNGDGVVFTGANTLADPGDRRVIGNSTRRYQFGVNGTLSYKNFDFSFFASGVGKRDLWISDRIFFPFIDQFGALFEHQLDYWTPTNTDAYYPRSYAAASGNTANGRMVQTKYLSNGAYLRLKNVTVGYTLPAIWLQKIGISKLRVFAGGENLLTLDHLPAGMDPEATNISAGGIYPFIRKYTFGANLSF